MRQPHPSGRPIRRLNAKAYSMQGDFQREGYVLPRLREADGQRHDTHAVGFINLPVDEDVWHGMQAKDRKR